MFLPQCERPSFMPIPNNRQNYSSVYLNLYIFGLLFGIWTLITLIHTYIHTYSFHFINPFSARLHLDMKHVRRESVALKPVDMVKLCHILYRPTKCIRYGFWSSGMWDCINGWVVPNILKECCLHFQVCRGAGNHLYSDNVSHPTWQESSITLLWIPENLHSINAFTLNSYCSLPGCWRAIKFTFFYWELQYCIFMLDKIIPKYKFIRALQWLHKIWDKIWMPLLIFVSIVRI